uniref:Uncharacterized protein n=1 Tax=Amphimedon queenslandica TaxID=400682 RepID=A0A1X7SXH9_AMPQE
MLPHEALTSSCTTIFQEYFNRSYNIIMTLFPVRIGCTRRHGGCGLATRDLETNPDLRLRYLTAIKGATVGSCRLCSLMLKLFDAALLIKCHDYSSKIVHYALNYA